MAANKEALFVLEGDKNGQKWSNPFVATKITRDTTDDPKDPANKKGSYYPCPDKAWAKEGDNFTKHIVPWLGENRIVNWVFGKVKQYSQSWWDEAQEEAAKISNFASLPKEEQQKLLYSKFMELALVVDSRGETVPNLMIEKLELLEEVSDLFPPGKALTPEEAMKAGLRMQEINALVQEINVKIESRRKEPKAKDVTPSVVPQEA